MTAWRINEREAKPGKATGGFLGSVAVAPALRPTRLINAAWKKAGKGPVGDAEGVFFMDVLQRVYGVDKFNRSQYITDEMAETLKVADQGCLPTASVAVQNLTLTQLYKDPSWVNGSVVAQYEKELNQPGPFPLAGPMLVAQGTGDKLVFADLTVEDFNATCAKYPDSPAELVLYPGLDHTPTMAAALSQIFPWIHQRFAGVNGTKHCSRRTIKMVDTKY